MTDESLILSGIGTGRNGARQVGAMLGYKAVPHGNFPDAVLPVEISFTRASTGMEFVNGLWQSAAINMPRRYNDSYLNEPAAQNRWLMSSCFGAVPYGGSITNAGESTIFKDVDESIYTEGVGSGLNGFYDSIAVTSGTTYTLSCFIKYNAGTQRFGRLSFGANFAEGNGVTIDLTTGALSTPPSGITATSLNAGNGWWRISITQTANGTGNSNITIALAETSGGSILYTGNGSSVKVQGGQFETGSVATSPIITAGSAVTRLKDDPASVTIPLNQTELTLFFDGKINSAINLSANLITTNQNTTSAIGILRKQNGKINLFVIVGGVSTINVDSSSTYTLGQEIKVAAIFKSGECKLYINGVLEGSSAITYTFTTSITQIHVLSSTTYFGYQENALLNEAKVIPLSITGAEAIALTTI